MGATPKKSKYDHLYHPAETEIIYNDVKDLTPIHVPLPPCPPLHTIEGYGLPPEDQYWVRKPLPDKLLILHNETSYVNPDNPEAKPTPFTPRMKVDYIERNADFYAQEIQYIQDEWERRENGHWFFNNGTPTFLTGDNYFYLQWITLDGDHPDFRRYDWKWFHFWNMVEYDDFCYGMNIPKSRRVGDTSKVQSIRLEHATRIPYYKSGLQSKNEIDATKVHEFHLRIPSLGLPFFFQPVQWNRLNTTSEMRYTSPETRSHPDYGTRALNSFLDYRDSSEKAYDGTKQWLIHNDEVGKYEDVDLLQRIRIQIPCLKHIIKGSSRKGKVINTSTVDEMEKGGGRQFKKLCDSSDYHKRNDNGYTRSGLYTLFLSALEGIQEIDPKTKEPYIDKYGYPQVEKIRTFLTNQRDALRKAGDINGYIELCRQYPIEYRDCWKSSAKDCLFNLQIIEDRIEELKYGTPLTKRGNFEWLGGQKDTRVIFVPNNDGRFCLSWDFPQPEGSNKFFYKDGLRYPSNKKWFVAGADPFKFDKIGLNTRKGSNGALAIFMKHDKRKDNPEHDISTWTTHRFICTYSFRPPTTEEYAEDLIKACFYFGCELYPENNVPELYKYFIRRGYAGYLMYKFDEKKQRVEDKPGDYTTETEVQDILMLTQEYVQNHGNRECHIELLEEWKEVQGSLREYDLTVAAGKALVASQSFNFDIEDQDTAFDLSELFETVNIDDNGNTTSY